MMEEDFETLLREMARAKGGVYRWAYYKIKTLEERLADERSKHHQEVQGQVARTLDIDRELS